MPLCATDVGEHVRGSWLASSSRSAGFRGCDAGAGASAPVAFVLPLTGGQSALGHRVSAQSRLVRPVYDLRAEPKDDGENFLLLFGSNLILVQHIFKVPGHDFKISSGDAETMVRLLSGSANYFTRSAGHIAQ